MTVSDTAENRWFYYRIAFAILFCLIAFGPHGAIAQTAIYDGGICKLANRSPEPVTSYRIIPKTTAPSRPLKPGDTYDIAYEIYTSCKIRCADVAELDLPMLAKLGKNKGFGFGEVTGIAGSGNSKIIGKAKMFRHTCGEVKYRVVTYTVPYPGEVKQNFDRENTWMTIGLCPPNGFECAKHSIFVENVEKSGWRVRVADLLTVGGSGPNQVIVQANIKVTNQTGSGLWPDHRKRVEFWRVARVGQPANLKLDEKPLPAVSSGSNTRVEFRDTVTGDGVRWYYACLTGPDKNGWPTPRTCSPAKVIDVSLSDGQRFEVGTVGANPAGRILTTAPAGRSFRASFTVRNKTTVNVPAGNKFFNVWQRQKGTAQTGNRVAIGTLGPLRGSGNILKSFRVGALPAGIYEFRACVASRREEHQTRAVCGPWSTITVGAKRVRPAPQPVAPVANRCTGGRAKNAQGRCVCPVGSFWNPNPGFKRCYTCTGGRVWSGSQRRCVCPTGTKWNPRAKRCATALQILPTPQIRLPALGAGRAIKCAGGTVSNGQCLCPRGFTRRTIRKNVYVCKPPFKQPIPGASQIRPNPGSSATTLQNQFKKPAAGKMQCIGGQVKGPLCWCGLGRFPKKVGNNVYRCQ